MRKYNILVCINTINLARLDFIRLLEELRKLRVHIKYVSKSDLMIYTKNCKIHFIVRSECLQKYTDYYDALYGFSYVESVIVSKNKEVLLNPYKCLTKYILIKEGYLLEEN